MPNLLATDGAWPVLDNLTLDLVPFSHLKMSEMDEDLSGVLFWVCECSSEHPRCDILTRDGTLCLLKILRPRRLESGK